MKSHARLHKTLASLALAMTATAIFLHAMDPSVQAARPQLSKQEMIDLSKDLVMNSVSLRPRQWHEVEIFVEEGHHDSMVLAASRNQRHCHFFVDSSGRVSRESAWSRQVAHTESPHAIRIQIEQADSGPELVSPAQLAAVQSLVAVLDSTLAAGGNLPVQLRSPGTDSGM